MPDTDPALLSAAVLVGEYRRRALSPVEATEAVLARIARFQPEINAFVLVDGDRALDAARASEARWARGAPLGPVDGVPTTIKDTQPVAGWPTRVGSRTTPEEPAEADGPAPARLREGGAVLLGKTTTPEFGWKGVTDSPLTGVTRNPWKPDMSPGGSSGGAAAAAALGLGALHTGSDAGGSVRIPACMTGVFGLKPTFGRVPAHPPSAFGTLAHIGPLTRTVEDAALMLTVLAGPDRRDPWALPYDHRDWRTGLDAGLAGLRIGYDPAPGGLAVDPEVARLIDGAAQRLVELGGTVEPVALPFEGALDCFMTLYTAVARGIVVGTPKARRAEMDPGLRAFGERTGDLSVDALLAAEKRRTAIAASVSGLHARYDVLIGPTLAVAGVPAGRDAPLGPDGRPNLMWMPFTPLANLTRQPAASFPIGLTPNGLPVGLHVSAAHYREVLVLRTARALETALPILLPPMATA